MPGTVTDREAHSINVISMTETCIWVMAVGGDENETDKYAFPGFALFEISE